jgi:hypothetical protein
MLADAARLQSLGMSFQLDEVQSQTSEKVMQATAGCRAGVNSCYGFGGADKMLRNPAITAVILVLEVGT